MLLAPHLRRTLCSGMLSITSCKTCSESDLNLFACVLGVLWPTLCHVPALGASKSQLSVLRAAMLLSLMQATDNTVMHELGARLAGT